MAKENMKTDKAQDKAMIKKAFGMHDKQEHKGEHTNLSTLKKGGMTMKKMAKGGMDKFEKSGKDVEKKGMKEGSKADMALDKKQMMGMKKGGCAKMSGGGMPMVTKDGKKVPAFAADGVGKMKKGGMAGMHMMPNGKMMKNSDMPMKKGGCAKMAKGGGIEVRGKTKGRMC